MVRTKLKFLVLGLFILWLSTLGLLLTKTVFAQTPTPTQEPQHSGDTSNLKDSATGLDTTDHVQRTIRKNQDGSFTIIETGINPDTSDLEIRNIDTFPDNSDIKETIYVATPTAKQIEHWEIDKKNEELVNAKKRLDSLDLLVWLKNQESASETKIIALEDLQNDLAYGKTNWDIWDQKTKNDWILATLFPHIDFLTNNSLNNQISLAQLYSALYDVFRILGQDYLEVN